VVVWLCGCVACAATWNIDGGVLDFFVLNGPNPQAAVAQYHEVIGTPHMPPYWSLGWHQCKYGWPNLQTLKAVVANYSAAGIPLDTMWSDIVRTRARTPSPSPAYPRT
jgi:alpha-glucosidase (family GH31 glycosyl hydrolase)